MEIFFRLIRFVLPLAFMSVCLFGYVLHFQSGAFRECQAAVLSLQWMLLFCLSLWDGTLIFLTFSRKDWPLIALLLIGIAYSIRYNTTPSRLVDAAILLAGVTLGRGTRFALMEDGETHSEIRNQKSPIEKSLVGLVGLLAFGAWWHLEVAHSFYPGMRWTGLWNNPNIYGMLMGAGLTLAVGLLSVFSKFQIKNLKLAWFLYLAAGMMGVGLVMSCSRGAGLATAIGLLYLVWYYGKFRWRWVLSGVLVVMSAVFVLWHSTTDTSPWYHKRLDFSRPSAQHRVLAWRGAVQMMWDHPLGVGWNQAVSVYDKHYSPPEGGAPAITMNSYLMLGTELGLPGLLCFVAYMAMCFSGNGRNHNEECRIKTACRAGALVFVVAFWFDGGLFDLPTAAVFWILLELGTSDLAVDKNYCVSSS
jgi:hypothetical protein